MLLFLPLAHAENIPCTAEASGPGWRANVSATLTNMALTHVRQEVVVDIPAIDQGESAYEYNGLVNRPAEPMARVRIVQETDANQPQRTGLTILTPEVYSPTEVLMAGVMGGEAPPLVGALKLVAGGNTMGWYLGKLQPSPVDLPGNNVNVYSVTLGDGTRESVEATTALDAMAASGELRVETMVGTPDKDGKRPLPTKDASTELAGSFVINAAVLGPAMMGLQGLQPQLGAQLAQGKCGDVQAGGGKK